MPPLTTILGDIMGLTKINYNSCNFNDGLPVTGRFAQMVGEVLTMGSARGPSASRSNSTSRIAMGIVTPGAGTLLRKTLKVLQTDHKTLMFAHQPADDEQDICGGDFWR
jgi:hypothetical protein